MVGIKEDKISHLREVKFMDIQMLPLSWGCFGSLLWKTWRGVSSPRCEPRLRLVSSFSIRLPFPPLWIIQPIASFSRGPFGQKTSLQRAGLSLKSPSVVSTQPMGNGGSAGSPRTPSLYFLSFLCLFLPSPAYQVSTDSTAQPLYSMKQSWVFHGVEGKDGSSIPTHEGRQQDKPNTSFPHGRGGRVG